MAFLPCPNMCATGASNSPAAYKNISPAKQTRSLSQLIKFQKGKSTSFKNLSLLPKKSVKNLNKSPVTLTNYPSCQVCHQDQCQYDDNHAIGFLFACAQSMNDTLDSMLENPLSACLKKPPDDDQTSPNLITDAPTLICKW